MTTQFPDDWVVLELSSRSEGEDPDAVSSAIRRALPKAEVYIPAVTTQIGDDRRVHSLVDGYAFVRRVYPDNSYFRLEGTKFVQTVLSKSGAFGRTRRVDVVKTRDIDKMRQQVQVEVHQGIGIGDTVLITTGPARNITATVIEEIPEQQLVQVLIKLRSKTDIVTIPRSGLTVVERATTSPIVSRLTDLGAWLRRGRPALLWRGHVNFEALQHKLVQFSKVGEWVDTGRSLFRLVSFHFGSLNPVVEAVQERSDTLRHLRQLETRFTPLLTLVKSFYGSPTYDVLTSRFLTLAWLTDLETRMTELESDVESLSHSIVGEGQSMQNIVVDGHNLAYRCHFAPGLGDLRSSKGQATGVIVGVLRSLGSLKKRFPEARFYVAWDGSNRRRKKVFGEYKAGRSTPDISDQTDLLKQLLPYIGVRQLTNTEEEADDIIASTVRVELAGQRNLIFGNDKDLLQLVTPTTSVLVPGTGIRKEILYTPDLIAQNWELPVDRIVHYRAFAGDDSDNIPGVPRIPKKIFTSLVQAHGGVDQVYRSGLAGLSKGQYERLRSSEPQVRINLTLMTLVDVPVTTVAPNPDPDVAASLLEGSEVNSASLLEPFTVG